MQGFKKTVRSMTVGENVKTMLAPFRVSYLLAK
jgi:hypothetical protein